MFLQYLQKRLWGEVDFLHANKRESFLEVDSITLGLLSQACQKHPKQIYL